MKVFKIIGFWLLSLTWGIIMSAIGAIIALFLLITGHKPKLFHGSVYFEFGNGWGGMNAGCFFFCSKTSDDKLKSHEWGHGIQNIILGPLFPFLVAIPSVVRYWYREYLLEFKRVRYWDLPNYDAIWFEGWATNLGEKMLNNAKID